MKTQNHRFYLPVISILLFISLSLKAQDYIPLVYDGTHWIIRFDETDTPQPVDGLWEYYTNGDTILGSTNYTKVYYRSLVITQDGPPFEALEPYHLFGYLREDSIERKVYAIQNESYTECPENSEFLLYDFSLNVGDTADFCLLLSFMDNIVTSIDPEVRFGFETNTFSTDYFDQYQYYEGMGSVFGLFETMFIPVGPSKKQTLGVSSLYYYCRESPCSLLVNEIELGINSSFSVGPNPTQGELFISIPDAHDDLTVSLYNIHGLLISQHIIKENINRLSIELRSDHPGILFLNISQKNKVVFRKKILVTTSSY